MGFGPCRNAHHFNTQSLLLEFASSDRGRDFGAGGVRTMHAHTETHVRCHKKRLDSPFFFRVFSFYDRRWINCMDGHVITQSYSYCLFPAAVATRVRCGLPRSASPKFVINAVRSQSWQKTHRLVTTHGFLFKIFFWPCSTETWGSGLSRVTLSRPVGSFTGGKRWLSRAGGDGIVGGAFSIFD